MKHTASFRDPSGFIFSQKGAIYRQINQKYQPDYDTLMKSGLYKALVDAKLLVPHTDVTAKRKPVGALGYKVIKPQLVPFISYPYEWSFSQLQDAALATLRIQTLAMEHGMSLKDASAYNIQFVNGKPMLIDTLSFEIYKEGAPWFAYRQFCQHFLAPLALMAHTDVRLLQLCRGYIDGIPLDLAAKLLPASTKLSPSLASHIHIHARSQAKYANKHTDIKVRQVSRFALNGLIHSLTSAVTKLEWKPKGTEWGDYYTFTNYTDRSFKQKKKIIEDYLKKVKPAKVWDLGANTGLFSRIASTQGIQTAAFDIDPAAVEKNYRQVKESQESSILPLVMDLTNPSPGLGWAHQERESLLERGPADMVFALAIIHHLAISNNVPFAELAAFFARAGKNLVIEFVPKGDSQVDILLATREDIFTDYNEAGFEAAFGQYFQVVKKDKINGSKRTLYLMKALSNGSSKRK